MEKTKLSKKQLIKLKLIEKNMTQAELSEKINTNRQYLNNIINGRRSGVTFSEAIERALNSEPEKESNFTEFGIMVKKRLVEIEMTQTELAEKCGCTKQYLHAILVGRRPNSKYISKILYYLE